jgi:DNA-binding SARP family transcriptional activator
MPTSAASELLAPRAQPAERNGAGLQSAGVNRASPHGAPRAPSRFLILGALTISDGNESVVLRPSKPATLLAALMLRPNDVVSVISLQRALWGDHPPANARTMLHTCVLRLRRLLADFGIAAHAIETVPGGYRFPATAATLDLVQFRDLVRSAGAADDPGEELRLLTEALALWRGTPLTNIRSDTLERDEVPRLTEEWLRVTERRFEIEMSLGRHRQILPELRALGAAHPGHEPFWKQLIEALYRADRQADALAEYRTVKAYLRGELGVDPSQMLQSLELRILRGEEPAAASPRSPTSPAPPVPLASHPPTSTGGPAGPGQPVACLLPPDLPYFTGRDRQVEALVAQLTAHRSGPAIAVISGPPGIGKTALAVHVAHLVRISFPDGQWAVRLGTRDGDPQPPQLIAAELTRQVGGIADPDGDRCADATAGLQTAMTHRRMLLLLDDAASPEQVTPLLPANGGSAVIITSNRSLVGLAAARGGWVHRLAAFDMAESCAMLEAILGRDRVTAEPEAVREISALCGHYPVAIRIAATRLQNRPRQQLSDCAARLRSRPLHTLSLGTEPGMSLSRMLGGYLGRLDARLAQAFATIARSSDEDLSAGACARLLHLSRADAGDLLDELVDANVLEENAPGRYSTYAVLRSVACSLRLQDHLVVD